MDDKKLGSDLVIAKNIGTEITSRDLKTSGRLNCGPILGINKDFPEQPLGNCLLANRGTVHMLGDRGSQSRLTTGDSDRPLKRDNVTFLHEWQRYTTKVVLVNNYGRVPKNNSGCSVSRMPNRARKQARPAKPDRVREAERGPDGMTLGERLKAAMQAKSRMLGREYKQKDLLIETNQLVGRTLDNDPIITQQGLSLIFQNKLSFSSATPAFAAVLGVEALWLQYGVGPPTFLEARTAARK